MLKHLRYLCLLMLGLGLSLLIGCVPPSISLSLNSQPDTVAIATDSVSLSPPLKCELNKDCLVILYTDRDPSPKAVDFGCGRQTYDGHKGTDFAIPDERMMAEGVPVFASASGQVLRVRDGVEDRRIRHPAERSRVEGQECGNGVVIDHGKGWETQYCHLRRGSVAVKSGDPVNTETVLGMVGTSGLTSFPHVHITVTHDGQVVDPFVGPTSSPGCQTSLDPIWNQPSGYNPTGLIRAGFSTDPPDMDQIWDGKHSETVLSAQIPALLFWVQAYGILAGDEVKYRMIDPRGNVVVDHNDRIQSPSLTWVGYVGQRNSGASLLPGVWKAEYSLTRGDRVLINVQRQVQLNLT
ncbi:MAG: M23 family metallopeptidase [Arthrospira sp. PLM2.Bin9]|nr:M23 family metallopeptidase [Arthrospira sp. PLM2.Bin9]TVU55134.1 MAG: M23 family metallopeptidase [Arthrospira sp. PLM2.Bin9]